MSLRGGIVVSLRGGIVVPLRGGIVVSLRGGIVVSLWYSLGKWEGGRGGVISLEHHQFF